MEEDRDWHSILSTADDAYEGFVERWRDRLVFLSLLVSFASGLAGCHLYWTLFSSSVLERLEKEQFAWPPLLQVASLVLICFLSVFVHEVSALSFLLDTACEWAVHYIGRRQRSFALTSHHSCYLQQKHVERLASQIEANQCLEAFQLTTKHGGDSIAPILEALATVGHLEVLILTPQGRMTEREITAFHQCLEGNRRLRALSLTFDLQYSRDLGAAIVEGLSGSDSMEYINISGVNWEGLSHELCESVCNMPHLQELRLLESWGTPGAYEELLETATHHCPDLRVFRADVHQRLYPI